MSDEIEKSEQPNPDDVLAAITSFNDASIIINIFRDLGWTYSIEIKETLVLAKQNANLSIKFKALKHLRELLREAAESSGYTAKVSQTVPNAQGGQTTFSAKRIAGILNPPKQVESKVKESQNDKTEKTQNKLDRKCKSGFHKETRTESDRESDRGQSQPQESRPERITGECNINSDSTESIRDTRRAFPLGNADSGGTESSDGGETPRQFSNGNSITTGGELSESNNNNSEKSDNPCIKTRPPTCDQDLFPGISSAEK